MTTKYERQLIDDFLKQLRLIAEHYVNSSKEAVWAAHEDKMWEDASEKLDDLVNEIRPDELYD